MKRSRENHVSYILILWTYIHFELKSSFVINKDKNSFRNRLNSYFRFDISFLIPVSGPCGTPAIQIWALTRPGNSSTLLPYNHTSGYAPISLYGHSQLQFQKVKYKLGIGVNFFRGDLFTNVEDTLPKKV